MVVGIFTSVRKGAPMTSLRFVDAIAGRGLKGDRYESDTGAFPKEKSPVVRQVTLISEEAIIVASEGRAEPFTAAKTRRNIIVSLGIEELNSLISRRFMLGDVRMRAADLCPPCDRPDKIYGATGFVKAFFGRGGIRATILTDGRVFLEDPIVILD